jgi:radical SAM superfamily enzyme YgiQ (UPF0313 family)
MALDFGVESGDPAMLKTIRKGISRGQVVRALELARAEGIMTACSFMLGFPGETPAQLERTLRFMERIAPLVNWFSTLGVVVPFPGTPIYETCHERDGFTDWWLRDEYLRYEPPPPVEHASFNRYYTGDPALEADFFHYSAEMKALIRDCLRFKGEHNLRAMGWPCA